MDAALHNLALWLARIVPNFDRRKKLPPDRGKWFQLAMCNTPQNNQQTHEQGEEIDTEATFVGLE